jgi:hypothetical protein
MEQPHHHVAKEVNEDDGIDDVFFFFCFLRGDFLLYSS